MTDSEDKIATFNSQNPPPKVRRFLTKEPRGKTTETLKHGAFVFNAFDHLENLHSPTTEAFVDAQNARTEAFLSRNPRFMAERKEILKGQTDEDNEHVQDAWVETQRVKRGNRYFFSRDNEATSAYQFLVSDTADGQAKVYLDSAQFSKDHSVRVTDIFRSADKNHLAYRLYSPVKSNSELHVMHFKEDGSFTDVTVSKALAGSETVFKLDAEQKGVFYTENVKRKNEWVRELKHHTFGQSPKKDKMIATTLGKARGYSYPEVHDILDIDGNKSRFSAISIHNNFASENVLQIKDSVTKAHMTLGSEGDTKTTPLREVDGALQLLTTMGAPRGRIISMDAKAQAARIIVPQHEKDVMEQVILRKGSLFVNYRNGAGSRISAYDARTGAHQCDLPLPVGSKCTMTNPTRQGDDFGIHVESFAHSGETYGYNVEEARLTLLEKAEDKLKGAVVETIEATSKDGTKVPMTIIRPKDVKLDGTAAVQLFGYGGFNHLEEAGWREAIEDWVEKGGVYAVANLRGDGTFGKEWYDQGRLHNKQNVFDDFAACAETLIEKQYATPERLTINGASNGGLLTLATMLQRPELFGAVVSEVPVTDMLTDSWPMDYGKAKENRADFENNMSYSPLHTVKRKGEYPPLLVMTGAEDPTVPAYHSYKFAATMQARSPDSLCLLHVDKTGGHNASTSSKFTLDIKLAHAFIEEAIGAINQKKVNESRQVVEDAKSIISEALNDASWVQRVGKSTTRELTGPLAAR